MPSVDITAPAPLRVVACPLMARNVVRGGALLPPAPAVAARERPGDDHIIDRLDPLSVFFWRHPEFDTKVAVRPDGRMTTPVITDMPKFIRKNLTAT